MAFDERVYSGIDGAEVVTTGPGILPLVHNLFQQVESNNQALCKLEALLEHVRTSDPNAPGVRTERESCTPLGKSLLSLLYGLEDQHAHINRLCWEVDRGLTG